MAHPCMHVARRFVVNPSTLSRAWRRYQDTIRYTWWWMLCYIIEHDNFSGGSVITWEVSLEGCTDLHVIPNCELLGCNPQNNYQTLSWCRTFCSLIWPECVCSSWIMKASMPLTGHSCYVMLFWTNYTVYICKHFSCNTNDLQDQVLMCELSIPLFFCEQCIKHGMNAYINFCE